MKKGFYLFLVVCLLWVFSPENKGYAAVSATGFLDNNERTMVPIRFVSEGLGASVSWNQSQQLVTIEKEGIQIEIKIGEKYAKVNGNINELDTVAIIKEGNTYVPVRFVGEALNAKVTWNNAESTAKIEDNGKILSVYVARGKPIHYSKRSVHNSGHAGI